MPNRRRTKGERELIADIKKATLVMCNKFHKNYGCYDCPISKYVTDYGSCELGYVHYILKKEKMAEENNN